MALNLKLQMRMSQQLIMTPQLQQAIKLLQLSRNELEELIDQALIENPVLEESDDNNEESSDEPEEIKARVDSPEENLVEPQSTPTELEFQQYLEAGGGVIRERYRGDDGDEYSLEATLAGTDSLQDHLRWQLEMTSLSPLEMAIGEYLIGNLDDDGYLTISIQELLELDPDLHDRIVRALGTDAFTVTPPEELDPDLLTVKFQSAKPPPPPKKSKEPPTFEEEQVQRVKPKRRIELNPAAGAVVEGVLRFLQTLDPTGAGSRSLKECLEVQLKASDMEDGLAFRIVNQELKLLESKDLRKIARRQRADLEDVIEAYKLIMSLEPKPGRSFVSERPQHIIPDVYIYKFISEGSDSDGQVGQFRVSLNDSSMPRLKINDYYRELAKGKDADSSLTKEYIQEKIKAGNWLMKSIEQRQRTIFRVTKSILKHQYEFFEKGINFLKPLVLKDVAEDIEVHESTVSRITTNKYVHTPQGIFELKYFFTSGIDQGHGEVISSKKIKDLIQKIIGKENVRVPLTDIQIAEHLYQQMQIKVARRTVAKYREALNLLPSNKRKQLF
ncbi:MAG: RNA polymerase factor sigma-54 [SAR324 cluster bacterium]|nr:RNA polymerase factor sigma-54 [SAR324 cluster bacterium]